MRNCKFTSLSLMVPNFPILTIIAFYSLQAISTLTSFFYNSPITLAYINWICQWKKMPLEKMVLIVFGQPKVGNEHFFEILQFPFEGLAEMHNQIKPKWLNWQCRLSRSSKEQAEDSFFPLLSFEVDQNIFLETCFLGGSSNLHFQNISKTDCEKFADFIAEYRALLSKTRRIKMMIKTRDRGIGRCSIGS